MYLHLLAFTHVFAVVPVLRIPPLVEFMLLISVHPLGGVYAPCIYSQCQVRVTAGDSGLCCAVCVCVCVTSF